MLSTPRTRRTLTLLAFGIICAAAALHVIAFRDDAAFARDFASYYKAARLYGDPEQTIYDFRSDNEASNPLSQAPGEVRALGHALAVASAEIVGIHPEAFTIGFTPPYFYPPLLASVLRPMTFLKEDKALMLWQVMMLAAACALPLLIFAFTGSFMTNDFRARWLTTFLTMICCLPPILDNLYWRQVNIITTDLILLAFVLEKRFPIGGGAAWMLACAFKMSPAVFGFAFLKPKTRRIWVGAVLMGALVVFVTLPGGGLRYWIEFVEVVPRISAGDRMMMGLFPAGIAGNHSIKGMLFRLLPGTPAWGTTVYFALAFLCIAIAAAAMIREPRRTQSIPMLGALMLLISPMTWQGHLVVLAPGAAILISRALVPGVSFRDRIVFGLGAIGPIAAGFLPHAKYFDPGSWMFMGLLNSMGTIALLLLFGATAYSAITSSSEIRAQEV